MDMGSMALKLVADPRSFESGLLSAELAMERFGERANVIGNVTRAFDAIAAHPVGATLVAIVGTLNTLKRAAEGYEALNRQGQEAAVAQLNLQRRLGLSADEAGGLSLTVRRLSLDMGEVTMATTAFERHLAQAARGNTEAAAGFVRLGLDARQLSRMGTTDALIAIGDAAKRIDSPLERNAALLDVLTRRGGALIPIVMQEGAAFERTAAQAKMWGLTFTTAQAESVKAAKMAQDQAEQTFELLRQGVANQVAIGWAKAFQTMLPFLERAGEELKTAVEDIGRAAGMSGDWKEILQKLSEAIGGSLLVNLTAALKVMTAFAEIAAKVVAIARASPGQRIMEWTGAKLGLWDSREKRQEQADAAEAAREAGQRWHDEYNKAIKQLGTQGEAAAIRKIMDQSVIFDKEKGDTGFQGENELVAALARTAEAEKYLKQAVDEGRMAQSQYVAVLRQVKRAQAEAADMATNQLNATLREQLATFGMTAAEVERYKLAQAGATQAAIAQVEAVQNGLDAMKKATEAGRTLQGLSEQINRLMQAFLDGKITADEYRKAIEGIARARAAGLAAAIDQTTEALRRQAATAGMTSEEIKRWELAQAGASAAQIEAIRKMQDAAEIAKIHADNLSPYEKWLKDVQHIQELMENGLGAEDAAKELQKVTDKYSPLQGIALPTAATRGSSEAISAINRATAERTDPIWQLKETADAQKEIQADMQYYIKRQYEDMRDGKFFKVARF